MADLPLPAHVHRSTCTRLGPGRAVSFGVASVVAPAVHHGLPTLGSLAAVVVIACGFAAWSRSMRPAPRNTAALATMLVATQLMLHVALSALPHPLQTPPGAGPDMAGMHHPIGSDGATSSAWQMLAFHLSAVVIGALVLASLERRAVRAAIRCAAHLARVAARCASHFARPRDRSTLAGPSVALQRDASDAVARRIRSSARAHARRGPPLVDAVGRAA